MVFLRRSLRVSTAVVLAALVCYGCSGRRGSSSPAVQVTPQIVGQLPHDTLAFTQGLLYADGRLYESTGAPEGRMSSLRVLDAGSGAVLHAVVVPDVFAEGIAVLQGRLVQLTWRNGVALLYSFPALRTLEEVYEYPGEGWGLASDGRRFYMSDGTDTIRVLDSAFRLERRILVRMNGKPVRSLNELEYARGRLYANIWYSTMIVEIDPGSGRVMRVIDCAELVRRAGPLSLDKVLNGIAYDPSADLFYLTGKDWPVIFTVRIPRESNAR